MLSNPLTPIKFTLGPSKQKPKKNISEAELADDPDHSLLGFRLDCLRALKEKFVIILSEVLEKRVKEQMHIDNCKDSLEAIETVVTRDGWTAKDKGDSPYGQYILIFFADVSPLTSPLMQAGRLCHL